MGNWIGSVLNPQGQIDVSRKVDFDNPYVRRIIKAKEDMTGWERVQSVFSRDDFGELSPEMNRVKDATLIAGVVGAAIGGIGRSRIAYMDFFRQNVQTVFETPLHAKRILQDKVVLGMGSGAFRIGWRISAFTFIFMSGSTAIAAYRGKVGILDQVGGAGIAGFLYKIRDGPKAAFSGTVFGSLLGLSSGLIILGCVKLLGMDLNKANMYYYHRLASRQEKEHQNMIGFRESQGVETKLEKFHEKLYSSAQQPVSSIKNLSDVAQSPSSTATTNDASSKSKIINPTEQQKLQSETQKS